MAEAEKNKYIFSPEYLEKIGAKLVNKVEPIPTECEYCGKINRHRVLVIPASSETMFIWLQPLCDCETTFIKIEEAKNKDIEAKNKALYEEHMKKIDKLLKMSNMGERFKQRAFENWDKNEFKGQFNCVYEYYKTFKNKNRKYKGLIISGNNGTGKTHLAASVANALILEYIPVAFTTSSNMLNQFQFMYAEAKIGNTTENKEKTYYNTLCTVPLLILDDFCKEYIKSDWGLRVLNDIINYRYEHNLDILITTNFKMTEIHKRLSKHGDTNFANSICDRLIEMCKGVEMNGKSYRMEGTKHDKMG